MDFNISLKSGLLLFIWFFIVGCGEPDADLNNTKSYNKNGISFKYPGNWSLSDELTGDILSIYLETPGDTVVIIQNYPIDYSMNLKDFSDDFRKSMSENLPIGKISSQTTLSTSDTMVDEEFSISLAGETIPHRRKFLVKDSDKSNCFLIYQVPKEDYEKSQIGFEFIHSSFEFK